MTKNYFFFILLLGGLSFLSCNNNDDQPEKADPEGDCFTAKIDGELFESDNARGTYLTGSVDIMTLSATSGITDLPTFGISILAGSEGTFDILAQNGADVTATYSPAALTSTVIYGSTSGSMTISEWNTTDKRISGTFNFEGVNGDMETIQVTEGFFDIGYQ